ncbi:MAG: selenide, water dikinase SelD [Bacteroidales bacterium]|nr:selenide, water dikinase SelD [Bacteroidales bacterium]
MTEEFDLLSIIDQGGCSAKLSAKELNETLAGLPGFKDPNILVDIDTHDDGGVYKIRDDYALIQTTDFFPPVCSGAYDFGQIAAANAMSDVYAMGGQVLTALNIVMFPANLPLKILKEILAGGQEKVRESGGVIIGGHTIEDDIPKYGLAVTGFVHPDKIVQNNKAEVGDVLILTKPIGTGIVISAKKNKLASPEIYKTAILGMKQLNAAGSILMNKYGVKSATDITGFGLLGHAYKMASGSKVSIKLFSEQIPVIPGVMDLIEMGVIPGAAFRNKEYCEAYCSFEDGVGYNLRMLLFDAQTSGGLFMAVKPENSDYILSDLKMKGYPHSKIIGEVIAQNEHQIYIV